MALLKLVIVGDTFFTDPSRVPSRQPLPHGCTDDSPERANTHRRRRKPQENDETPTKFLLMGGGSYGGGAKTSHTDLTHRFFRTHKRILPRILPTKFAHWLGPQILPTQYFRTQGFYPHSLPTHFTCRILPSDLTPKILLYSLISFYPQDLKNLWFLVDLSNLL